jgi:hypothetical protein
MSDNLNVAVNGYLFKKIKYVPIFLTLYFKNKYLLQTIL